MERMSVIQVSRNPECSEGATKDLTRGRKRFFASLRVTKSLAVILSEAKNLSRAYGNHLGNEELDKHLSHRYNLINQSVNYGNYYHWKRV